jgi:F-type H+-transporting ATPase subunit b
LFAAASSSARVEAAPAEGSAVAEADGGATASHGEKGHHVDETDLSHANASDQLSSPAELRFELTLATMVVFLLLVALLGKFAWGPIAQGLDKREQSIADMIASAESNQRKAEARLLELERRLAEQAEEARQVLGAARREGEMVKEKIVAEAQAAAQAERDRAVSDIRSAKNQALQEIAQKSVNTAVDIAKSLIHREVRPDDHAQLIRDSLAQFQSQN